MTSRLLALLLVWALWGCEPCAFVVGGHCQDRQHDEQQDEEDGHSARRPAQSQPQVQPYYLPQRSRG